MVITTEPAVPPQRRSETRRSNKPIMEKRRRARINNCLNELKSLILDALKKDPARHSKLEKADILEMTVKHVEALQRHQAALTAAADPTVLNKFKAGWGECVTEVGRFPGLEESVKRRLVEHLTTCDTVSVASAATSTTPSPPPSAQPTTPRASPTHVLAAPQPLQQHHHHHQQQQQAHQQPNVLALVPTRLPNGNIALVLPSPPPQLPPSQPLSLVVEKGSNGRPWRPW